MQQAVHNTDNDKLITSVLSLITENHDLQVRFRWGVNDLAIWDK